MGANTHPVGGALFTVFRPAIKQYFWEILEK
jgi:hypothetical protein